MRCQFAFPFLVSPSHANYFLVIMEDLGMILVTFLGAMVYFGGQRRIRSTDIGNMEIS